MGRHCHVGGKNNNMRDQEKEGGEDFRGEKRGG